MDELTIPKVDARFHRRHPDTGAILSGKPERHAGTLYVTGLWLTFQWKTLFSTKEIEVYRDELDGLVWSDKLLFGPARVRLATFDLAAEFRMRRFVDARQMRVLLTTAVRSERP